MVGVTPAIRNPARSRPQDRHLRAFGFTGVAGGGVAAAAGIVRLSYEVYGWAAHFLVLAALNLAAGYWELTTARSG